MRKYFIVGTSGHIDHGKTQLVKYLTGIDTDRLKEEKERGISIELGYAYLKLNSGAIASFIDVPGHERLVRKMISGSYGIDLSLLVIAANEGFKPQTMEHLSILNFLGLKKGIIVVSKVDLVNEEELHLLADDINRKLKNTFFKESPIVYTSTITGQGIPELINLINQYSQEVSSRDFKSPFRLFVDRVFTMTGFGTVITGTAYNGFIKKEQIVEILPKGYQSRVRSLEVHNQSMSEAFAGERIAINLTDIKTGQITRGDVICQSKAYKPTLLLGVSIELLSNLKIRINNQQRIRFCHGSSEVMGRVFIAGGKEINSGETKLAYILLENPVVAKEGDRFIIRSYSPVITLGGGKINNPYLKSIERNKQNILTYDDSDSYSKYKRILESESNPFMELTELSTKSQKNPEELIKEISQSVDILLLPEDQPQFVMLKTKLEHIKELIIEKLTTHYKNNPHLPFYPLEELRNRLHINNVKLYRSLIKYFVDLGLIELNSQQVCIKGTKQVFSGNWGEGRNFLLETFKRAQFSPPDLIEMLDIMEKKGWKKDRCNELLKAMIEAGDLTRISEDLYYLSTDLNALKHKILQHFKTNNELSPSDIKNLLNISRKYAIPLLEWLDSSKFTYRSGNSRKLRSPNSFNSE